MDITRATAAGNPNELALDHGSNDDIPLTESESLPETGLTTGAGLGAGFGDHKAPGAFRTIGEVARALGIRQHVLRYWEEQFPMLSPVKRSGNRRYYRPEDVALIEEIDRLVHREGYTLRGARLALEPAPKKGKRGQGDGPQASSPAAAENAAPGASSAALLDELLAIRATLVAALVAALAA